MGLSGPVAAVILVTALLAEASALYTAHRNADVRLERAHAQWERRQEAVLAHAFTIENATWNATRSELNITLNNTGLVTLNASRVEVLLDGQRATGNVTARLVNGVASGVWPPGRALNLTLTAASKPVDAAVVSPWGLLGARRGI